MADMHELFRQALMELADAKIECRRLQEACGSSHVSRSTSKRNELRGSTSYNNPLFEEEVGDSEDINPMVHVIDSESHADQSHSSICSALDNLNAAWAAAEEARLAQEEALRELEDWGS
ncbi:hypothetical protein AMTR_s00096p00097880 [Amborella trichopoda]|uniref:Uncharacterized protein n=1 Tax=Amborella trichopoda TaxID=13333 RepID=W1P389_AMBTC|nr:hypothetical protein AMTR_s00096p00097880 [Amborella trichopoda]